MVQTVQGDLCIEVDHAYIRAHPYPRNSIDEVIVQIASSKHATLDLGLSHIKEHLASPDFLYELGIDFLHSQGKFPREALKFDDHAWREIGDYIVGMSPSVPFVEAI